MTNDEARNVAIWATHIADQYNIKITSVIEIFKAINKYQKDTKIVKGLIVEGFTGAREDVN